MANTYLHQHPWSEKLRMIAEEEPITGLCCYHGVFSLKFGKYIVRTNQKLSTMVRLNLLEEARDTVRVISESVNNLDSRKGLQIFAAENCFMSRDYRREGALFEDEDAPLYIAFLEKEYGFYRLEIDLDTCTFNLYFLAKPLAELYCRLFTGAWRDV